ncbi:MAG: adenylate/guanylate cyclase domain-containing protein [Chloroflexi bacterium]|nr:MAG: adenylate/guanylate cyclase domain-containing protein [Chloroflexota bacterium]
MPTKRVDGGPRRHQVKPPTGTVTFLFTDVEGSTRLAQRRPHDYEQLLDRHRSLLRQSLARHSGYEVGTEGDSFFVAFASPGEALLAAADGQRALTAEDWPAGADVAVRMGLHLGEATERDGDYVGVEIHRAARIAAAGHGGQVLVSGAVVAVVGGSPPDDFGFRELGEFGLKDFDAPTRIYQLTGGGLPTDFPPLRAPPARLTNLPERRSSFIGRRQERAAVGRALRASRLVTLTGAGGSGKTSLALEAAREHLTDYADGAWLAECAALRDPDYVATTVGHVLGVAEDPNRSAREALAAYLSRRRVLLVLDNLEQLLPEVALLVDDLLEAATGLRVLATSRQPLHLTGEQELDVPPLDVPDATAPVGKLAAAGAVRLFLERARSVDSQFVLTVANRDAVVGIVRRLDGLPLAIELAAARVKLLSPTEILNRLSHGSGELGQPDAPRPGRQRTLREAIGWSYRLLPAPEREFFARMSVFAGGCALESADQICNPDRELSIDSLDALGSLVDKSLLKRVETASGSRFVMLETIRDFARAELENMDPGGLTGARHARHMSALAEAGAPEITRVDGRWRKRLGEELDNLRAALAWAIDAQEAETGMRLCAALWRFWQMRALLAEGRDWCDRVLALPSPGPASRVHAKALLAAGSIAYWQRDWDHANRFYRTAVTEAESIGEERLEAEGLVDLVFLISMNPASGQADEWIEMVRRIKDLGERLHEPMLAAHADFAQAGQLMASGELGEARARIESVRLIFEASGDVFLAGSANSIAGGIAFAAGDLEESRIRTLAAAEYFHSIGDEIALQMGLRTLASVASRIGEPARGARLEGFTARLVARTGGMRFSPPFEPEDALELARGAIGSRADEEWARGEQMSRDEAMAVARTIGQPESQR